ncbi:MAG: hypothetical protein KF809_09490 [Chloroflexi bacterium]|nr:hypothetical protein [Chloroflexota bacterium]
MYEKSHKGQRKKGGCGWLCDHQKRVGNGRERRPVRDRRWLLRSTDEMERSEVVVAS